MLSIKFLFSMPFRRKQYLWVTILYCKEPVLIIYVFLYTNNDNNNNENILQLLY